MTFQKTYWMKIDWIARTVEVVEFAPGASLEEATSKAIEMANRFGLVYTPVPAY